MSTSLYEVNMLICFKQKVTAAKVVQVYISKLNTEIIDILRQLKSPSTETAGVQMFYTSIFAYAKLRFSREA